MEKIAIRKIEDIKTTHLDLEFLVTVLVPTLKLIFAAAIGIANIPVLPWDWYLGFEWILGPY